MYVPAAHAVTEVSKLHDFMRRYSFATLITSGPAGLTASHLPLLLDPDAKPGGCLFGHMARANSQWRDVRGEVLAVFSGPHTYISPSWYEEDATVPTWNYAVVHAYGTFQTVEDRASLLDILRRSVQTYESARPEPWPFAESAPHVGRMLGAIVGFRIAICRLEGKWKLSQNHSDERRVRVIRALESRDDDDSRTIAVMMNEEMAGGS
jgi:transcriptional regulator